MPKKEDSTTKTGGKEPETTEPAQDDAAINQNPKNTESAEEEKADDSAAKLDETVFEEGAILEPGEYDVLNGRGASVNANRGNQVFRALCFKRKPEFDAASHAAKRRIATEIVSETKAQNGRFLKRKADKGPWFEVSDEKAIQKACQVMRDYQRPDRVALRAMVAANPNARKRQRTTVSTPMDPAPVSMTFAI